MTTREITVSGGRLRGRQLDGAVVWRGIPYAAPPVDDLRFLPPHPAEPWKGVRDATTWGAKAMQTTAPEFDMGSLAGEQSSTPPVISEDCLFLNVTSPDRPLGGASAPVLVWIHGGGFVSGSGSDIGDGLAYARDHGIVFVSINYRLGALGFLNFSPLLANPDESKKYRHSGNLGLLDQIAALQWVHENIAAFGGDPARVTIAGGSAGAKAVATLLATPSAEGLFSRAISQSGGGNHALPSAETASIASELLDRCGVSGLKGLLTLPAEVLVMKADEITLVRSRNTWLWCPTIIGDVLPRLPIEAILRGSGAVVPLLAGSNSNEAASFTATDPEAALPARRNLKVFFGADAASAMVADYEVDLPGSTAAEIDMMIMTDERYTIPTHRLVEAQSSVAPCYRYLFAANYPGLPPFMTGGHGMESPYVFGLLPPADTEATGLSSAIVEYWASFVSSGVPTVANGPEWAAYEPGGQLTMVFDPASDYGPMHLECAPESSRYAIWADRSWETSRWF